MLLAAPLLLVVFLRCPERGGASAIRAGPSPAASNRPAAPEASSSRRPPLPPAAPERLRFRAHTFQHLLWWEPGSRASPGLLYDVQYRRYGNHSWTPLAHCTAIDGLSCDLTDETAEPSRRYFARVRAVAPDSTSRWTRAGPFSPKEATLQLRNMSLSLSGNLLRVTLELPVHRGRDSAVVAYEDLHPGGWGRFRVYVRRASSNSTEYERVETNRTFELPALSWGERYCVSVEPLLPSRPNPARRTEEQCVSTPPPTGSARAAVLLSLALLSLAALGLLAAASRVCAYVKKPMETPPVLKSFREQTSPWLQSEPRPPGMNGRDLCLEVESIHPISLGMKSHPHLSGVSQPSRASWRVPEEGRCRMPEDFITSSSSSSRAESPQWLRERTDSSGCSTDSGICLQEPLGSHSVLLLLSTGPRECGELLPGSDTEGGIRKDCGLEPEEQLVQGAPPASKAEPVGLDSEEVLKQADLPRAQASGYQRQAAGPVEVLGSSSCPPIFEDMAQSKPVSASGYLKQTSVAVHSAPGPLAVAPEAGLGASTDCFHHGQLRFLSSVAPGGSGAFLPCLSELPKALLASSFLEQAPVWPPPHLSLLRSSTPLSPNLPWGRV